MNSLSVDTQQDSFSIESFLANSAANFSPTRDWDASSLAHENQEPDLNEATNIIQLIVRSESHKPIEPLSFSKQNIRFDRSYNNDLDLSSCMNFFRSIAKPLHKDWTLGPNIPALDKWVSFSLAVNSLKIQQNIDEISLYITSQEYFVILLDILKPFSFSISDLYEDPYGGKVADYFKGKERVSCIVSIQHVQILSFLDDVFKEKVFERSGEVKLEISKYVESLLASRHDDRLDASKES